MGGGGCGPIGAMFLDQLGAKQYSRNVPRIRYAYPSKPFNILPLGQYATSRMFLRMIHSAFVLPGPGSPEIINEHACAV